MPAMWSELPRDVVATILGKLCWVYLTRAGAVCRSWLAATIEIKAVKVRLPFLLLVHKKFNQFDVGIRNVIDTADNTVYQLHLLFDNSLCYVGSFDEWLIGVHWNSGFVLNPLSGKRIQLPRKAKLRSLALGTQHEMIDFLLANITKATLSTSPSSSGNDCLLVALYSSCKVAVCKLNPAAAASFTVFEAFMAFELGTSLLDITCYRGCAYAVTNKWQLVVFELHPKPKPLLYYFLLPPPQAEMGTRYGPYIKPSFMNVNGIYLEESCGQERLMEVSEVYLVESCCGELLMVLQLQSWPNGETQGFHILKLSKRERRWVKVERLDGQMLFLSRSCSRAIPIVGFSGNFKENSICFLHKMNFSEPEFAVFSLEDNSRRPLLPSNYLPRNYFKPSLQFIWPP